MPLAFAGSAGGLLLLTGSPVNVVISEAAADAGVGAFGLVEFALVGIPLVAGTVLIVLALGSRLLPERESSMVPPDLSRQAAVLVEHYSLDNVLHLRAGPSSNLRRQDPRALGPRRLSGDQGDHRTRRGVAAAGLGRTRRHRRPHHRGWRPGRRTPLRRGPRAARRGSTGLRGHHAIAADPRVRRRGSRDSAALAVRGRGGESWQGRHGRQPYHPGDRATGQGSRPGDDGPPGG